MHHFYVWIVENLVLESLPVSSSGHIRLLERVYPNIFLFFIKHSANVSALEHALHAATVLVVALFFFNRWWPFVCNLSRCWSTVLKIIAFTFLIDCVTVAWFLVFSWIGVSWFPLWIGFAITALLLVNEKRIFNFVRTLRQAQDERKRIKISQGFYNIFNGNEELPDKVNQKSVRPDASINSALKASTPEHPEQILKRIVSKEGFERLSFSWSSVLLLGCLQGVALLPGISRLASTYIGGRFLGLSPKKAFGVSWLIVWPLLFVASLRGIWTLHRQGQLILLCNTPTLLIIAGSTIAAFLLLYLVEYMARTGRLWYFAIYLVIPIVISYIFLQS